MATSYEEIYRRIAEGRPADCEAAVEAELTLLVTFGGRVPVMIAVAIAEAQSFHKGDRDWLASAKERWNFPGDKTIFHYAAVGRMLLSLRDYADTVREEIRHMFSGRKEKFLPMNLAAFDLYLNK